MPIKNKEVEAFYKDLQAKANLSDDEKKLLESLLEKEDVSKVFEGGVKSYRRMQSGLDEIEKTKKDLQSEYDKKVTSLETLQNTYVNSESLTKKEKADLEQKMTLLEGQITNVIQKAKQYGNGDDFLKEVGLENFNPVTFRTSQIPPNQPNQSSNNQTKSFDEEAFAKRMQKQQSDYAMQLANFNIDLLKIKDEYKSLYGTDLDLDDFRTKTLAKNGDYWAAYREGYDIDNKRREVETSNLREKLKKELEIEFEQKYSSKGLPNERGNPESQFFKSINASIPTEALKDIEITSAGNPNGIENRNSTVLEAAETFQKLIESKNAA